VLVVAFLFAFRLAPDTPDLPLKQPQIAVAGKTVALTYGAGKAVYFSRSDDAGKTFSRPVKVAEAKFLALGLHRGPRIAIAGTNLVVTAAVGETRAGDLISWRSTDNGKTWSAGVRVNEVPDSAREGLHGMAGAPDGTLWITWLDIRHEGMRLYGALSKDGGATWGDNQEIYVSPDGHICECCHPTAQIGPQGELVAMWRNWVSGSRDMYYAISSDAKTWSLQKLGQGTWLLNACPMDGGGLALDSKSVVHSVWRRDATVYATSGNAKEIEVGRGKNPSIAVGQDGAYVVWTDGTSVKLKKPGSKDAVTLGEGAFPVLAGSSSIHAAWEHNGAIIVEQIR
jgi:hypothetical protein